MFTDGTTPADRPFAGQFMGHDQALQIALGNVDIQTKEQVDYFDPDSHIVSVPNGYFNNIVKIDPTVSSNCSLNCSYYLYYVVFQTRNLLL